MSQNLVVGTKVKFLALGDSYTIGESVDEHERWPNQLMQALRAKGVTGDDPKIIATTGWRTDQLKKAIEEQKPAKDYTLVSLLIGVNNQYQKKPIDIYTREFEELLTIAIEHARNNASNVFVVSIPDYGFTPFGREKQQTISQELDEYNAVAKTIAERHNVAYFYITDISRNGLEDPALVASDNLHPSAKMYSLWVERILQAVTIE